MKRIWLVQHINDGDTTFAATQFKKDALTTAHAWALQNAAEAKMPLEKFWNATCDTGKGEYSSDVRSMWISVASVPFTEGAE